MKEHVNAKQGKKLFKQLKENKAKAISVIWDFDPVVPKAKNAVFLVDTLLENEQKTSKVLTKLGYKIVIVHPNMGIGTASIFVRTK